MGENANLHIDGAKGRLISFACQVLGPPPILGLVPERLASQEVCGAPHELICLAVTLVGHKLCRPDECHGGYNNL